jgi:hypothetical protein
VNDFIIYANINQKGWKVLTTTTSRDRLENILHVILDSKENIQVIVVYSMMDRDIPLFSFNNKIQREIDMEKIYRWCK